MAEQFDPLTTGYMNYSDIMENLYTAAADGEEDAATGVRNLQLNMMEQFGNSLLAQSNAAYQSFLGQANASHIADLERYNQQFSRDDQFNKNMLTMDAEFNYSNKFADAQHVRDLGMLGASGEQARRNINAQGVQVVLEQLLEESNLGRTSLLKVSKIVRI